MSASLRTLVIAAIGIVALAGIAIVALKDSDAPSQTQAAASNSGQTTSAQSKGETPDRKAPKAGPSISNFPVESRSGAEVKAEQSADTAVASAPTNPASPGRKRYEPGPSKYRNAMRPEIRTILARVGADHEAEAMWLQSINDPSVPAKEREDLIEDLNEDGLSDPAKPTREDLALINNRIQLIDRLMPSAMDKVNEAAFKEARKDLVNMRDRLEE